MNNRIIKFRAWDGNKFIQEFNITEMGDVFRMNMFETYEPLEVKILQFTGLLDKNGKEIYEGDILSSQIGEDGYIGDVQFSHGTFGVEWNSAKKNKSMVGGWGQLHNLRNFDDGIYERLEVIGNIFEHPDLIKHHEQ